MDASHKQGARIDPAITSEASSCQRLLEFQDDILSDLLFELHAGQRRQVVGQTPNAGGIERNAPGGKHSKGIDRIGQGGAHISDSAGREWFAFKLTSAPAPDIPQRLHPMIKDGQLRSTGLPITTGPAYLCLQPLALRSRHT